MPQLSMAPVLLQAAVGCLVLIEKVDEVHDHPAFPSLSPYHRKAVQVAPRSDVPCMFSTMVRGDASLQVDDPEAR
jgi:hypothetical protein